MKNRAVVLMLLAIALPLSTIAQQVEEARAHVDAFIQALNSGTPEQWERMAGEHFAPSFLSRRPAEERKKIFERLRDDFGTLTITRITRNAPDGPLEVSVTGSTGTQGTFRFEVEPQPPHRITAIGIEAGVGGQSQQIQLPPLPIRGSMSDAELTEALDPYLKKLAAEDILSGVVLVARGEHPVFVHAYGYADRSNRVLNTPATRFNIGSIDKVFTQTAIEQLIARGKVSGQKTIGELLPGYPQELSRSATVDQLLQHRAGISDFFGKAFAAAAKDRFRSNADYYAFVSGLAPAFAPGARMQYCNGCYIVLGEIISHVAGMPYEQYIEQNIFRPAGMRASGWFQLDEIRPDMATGYTRRAVPGQLRSSVFMHGASGSAAGGGYATAGDLLSFALALKGGRIPDAKGSGGIGIAGGAPGTNASLEQNGDWTVVVLTNLDPPVAESLGRAIMQALTR